LTVIIIQLATIDRLIDDSPTPPRGLGGVVVIDAAIGAHGRGSCPAHYFTVAATLDKSLTSHCL